MAPHEDGAGTGCVGGAREYAARGIPLDILDANQPIINRLLAAPFHSFPDALARQPRQANLRVVNRKTIIGEGENRLELYPIRSESGERMLMVSAPRHRLLYGSDLVQPMPGGAFFMPQYLSELAEAAAREKLEVENVFAMHSGQVPWSEITRAIQKAMNPGPPRAGTFAVPERPSKPLQEVEHEMFQVLWPKRARSHQ